MSAYFEGPAQWLLLLHDPRTGNGFYVDCNQWPPTVIVDHPSLLPRRQPPPVGVPMHSQHYPQPSITLSEDSTRSGPGMLPQAYNHGTWQRYPQSSSYQQASNPVQPCTGSSGTVSDASPSSMSHVAGSPSGVWHYASPDNTQTSSWNGYITQPQVNPYNAQPQVSPPRSPAVTSGGSYLPQTDAPQSPWDAGTTFMPATQYTNVWGAGNGQQPHAQDPQYHNM
ncbi:hypothetical protein CERSUDRAFT_85536 [Gelatoporia subvermispora B]|uniref:Uncharacterized protein n=1 Tax=Ceriporiopsis subvermispora (strain B) TaxID=914234 RepID=M2R9Y8_CERS8|nr:hypothetical protein CERSUDRAFT_85536 [Gelatoporia subvermispora B]